MTAQPIVLVAGLGRCGTSLAMQMLHAAGLRCAGDWPSFEPPEMGIGTVDPAWLSQWQGGAVKALNPHWARLPAGIFAVFVWLDRDPREQARSQIKFVRLMGGSPVGGPLRRETRRVETALRHDRARALRAIGPRQPLLALRFEALLADPRRAAGAMAGFLAPWFALDTDTMAEAVRPRPAACAPGLAMERTLAGETATPEYPR